MDGTMLFIFLLDSLPANILNKTLETVQVVHTERSTIQKCDHHITDPLLQTISKELDVLMAPNWMFNEELQDYHGNNSIVNDTVSDSAKNTIEDSAKNTIEARAKNIINDTVYDSYSNMNKILDSEEKSASVEYHNIQDIDYENDKTEEMEQLLNITEGSYKKNITKLPERVPFLAAIFESISNVTGQTCAGTVVAPQWVLTAATCVNLLSSLYENSTNSTEPSVYTIIINATDPLVDGTAHNVTSIHLQPLPAPSDTLKNLTFLNKLPNILRNITKELADQVIMDEATQKLALMKIDPPAEVEGLHMLDGARRTSRVVVYGWFMKKDSKGHDSMHAVAVEAGILDAAACEAHYNITADTAELCLATSDDNADLVNQMSWGGPVTTRGGGMLGVTRVDGRSPLSAWPAPPHQAWIRSVIDRQ